MAGLAPGFKALHTQPRIDPGTLLKGGRAPTARPHPGMDMGLVAKDTTWWVYTLPAFLGRRNILDGSILFSLFMAFVFLVLFSWAFAVGGIAWKNGRNQRGPVPIPGPRGLPILGSLLTLSRGLAHRSLATMAWKRANTSLMAFSLGSTPVVVASDLTPPEKF
ncbi:hypothetical protein GH714_019835 [Hevea brasiliensis]|uniref:Uncharacterized protein n=1 Tax=Hevea brasiliensis TaxID=3981 RepID=A0A6A6K608_HEVBR|nr:hypothetical protein GH714_019835 [Hevea brasiliensis]